MQGDRDKIDLGFLRRYGAEIEVNAFDKRSRPVNHASGELPDGTHAIAGIVRRSSKRSVTIHRWSYDHNNSQWIIKPDSSCGIEVCSPVLKGWAGLKEICSVIEALGRDGRVTADDRCSFHVHVDMSDLTDRQLATVITWWVKCEPVFMDSVPYGRKRNQYCQMLAQSDAFERVEDGFLDAETLIRRLGNCKYYTINTYHLSNNKRRTMEFRIMDGECCLDGDLCKNWVRLILLFVERCLEAGMPHPYQQGDKWSGYCWLDPKDVFDLLGFNGHSELSLGASQVKEWFLGRLIQNSGDCHDEGVLSFKARHAAHAQIDEMAAEYGDPRHSDDDVLDDRYRI